MKPLREDVEFLAHYGVKGMKWGVRRSKRSVAKTSSDAKKVYPNRGKPVRSLTNKQIKEHNERINLEQQYIRLNPGKKQRGEARIKAVMGTAAVGVSVYNMANSPAGKAAIAAGRAATTGKTSSVSARAPKEYTALLRK